MPQIVRKFLTPDEFSNPAIRTNPSTGEVEVTPDGGETWVPAPTLDPRSSDYYRLPALTGSDPQCRAAVGMTEVIRQFVDARINATTAYELSGAIIGLVSFIPGFNVLWAIIVAFATFALTIGREILEGAFTEDVYEAIQCLFYSHIGSDGQMSESQYLDAYDAAADLPNPVAVSWVQNVMATLGWVGLSDAGVALEDDGDCSECGTWCLTIDLTASNGGFAVTNAGWGVWTSGVGWQAADVSNRRIVQAIKLLGMSIDVTRYQVVYDWTHSTTTSCASSGAVIYEGLTNPFQYPATAGNPCTAPAGTDLTLEINAPHTIDRITIDFQPYTGTGTHSGAATVKRVTLYGDGTAPTIAGWTEC